MVDNEKRDNLANARRKLKKFRDEQQQQNGADHLTFTSETNGSALHSNHGSSNERPYNYNNPSSSPPHDLNTFVNEQQAILNGIHMNLSKSPVGNLEEQNRQYALMIENQKQQRARLEDQRQFGVASSMSGRSSQTQSDADLVRHIEQKYRRDLEHLQEQLEIHVQTIGILVAEKTDMSARLTQSVKQMERKQSEIDEIQGRLKGSRERVEELEKHNQNSTTNAQRREMAAKESDREIERLGTENNRQRQMIEDLQQNLSELNEKLLQRQNLVEHINNENSKLKQQFDLVQIRLQQFQSINDTSANNVYEQQIEQLQKTILSKTNETDALLATVNQLRSDQEQMQSQYQQYNANVQRHIQELNEQMRQLVQTNSILENDQEALKQSYEMRFNEIQNAQKASGNDLILERDSLIQENQLFKNAIDQWSKQFEELRLINEELTRQLTEKVEYISLLRESNSNAQLSSEENNADQQKILQTIHEDKATLSRAMAQNKQLKDQLTELQDGFIKITNDNVNLTNRIQTQEFLNKQLTERLSQKESSSGTTVEAQNHQQPPGETEQILEQLKEENRLLRERLSQMEQQSQSQTTTDVRLNESNSLSSLEDPPQPQSGVVEKIIERFNRAMRENADLQDRTQQLEHLILQLQSETDTIGDYISLYQQQRQHLHRRYQEKDDYIKQLTHDRFGLQRKLSELESLLMRGLNKKSTQDSEQAASIPTETPSSDPQANPDENEWPDMIDNNSTVPPLEPTTTAQEIIPTSPGFPSLSNFDEETKTRILTLLKELGHPNNSSPQMDNPSTTKLAFIGKNLYVCSTCTGPVQWV